VSDQDIGQDLDATELEAVAAFEHGPHFILATLGDDGQLHTYKLTRNKLTQLAVVVLKALDGVPSGSIHLLRDRL
jgi:hypothetical protein